MRLPCDQVAFQPDDAEHGISRPPAHGTNTTLPGEPGCISGSQDDIEEAGQRGKTTAASISSLILKSLGRLLKWSHKEDMMPNSGLQALLSHTVRINIGGYGTRNTEESR